KLLKEVQEQAPCVLALQEVDHYEDIASDLRSFGYEGMYLMRDGETSDGCATFWKTSQFRLRCHHKVLFSEFGLRNNVALLLALEPIDESLRMKSQYGRRHLVVCNTHILFNPKRGDIKLAQVRMLMEQLAEFSGRTEQMMTSDSTDRSSSEAPAASLPPERGAEAASSEGDGEQAKAAVVIAGDFNAIPHSGIYHFMAEGRLDCLSLDRRRMGSEAYHPRAQSPVAEYHGPYSNAHLRFTGSQSHTKLSNKKKKLNLAWEQEHLQHAVGKAAANRGDYTACHPYSFRSAYMHAAGAEPAFTTYHESAHATVDYIWHTPQLTARRVLMTPSLQQLPHWCKGLLSPEWPSDHMSLVCDFVMGAAKPITASKLLENSH
ncbi:hypothetical protein CYMTET_2881, partial [Cymbomonas tetramitiformis]